MTASPAMESRPLLGRYFALLQRGQPWRWRGRVLQSLGQTIESLRAAGLGGRVLRDSGPVWAAAPGRGDRLSRLDVLSMPVETTEGIRFGDPVAALGVIRRSRSGRLLMGRVLNALGKPIDEGRAFRSPETADFGRSGALPAGPRADPDPAGHRHSRARRRC